MYLFRKAPNKWIFGATSDSECPAGIFRIEPSIDRTRVSIRYVQRDIAFVYAEPISAFLDSNDAPYMSFSAFQNACDGFFANDEAAPAGNPAFVQVRLIRPNDVVQYSANDVMNSSVATPVSINLANMALMLGKGGYLMEINAASNMVALADSTIRLWFYRSEPTGLLGDNFPLTNDEANITIGRHYIDLKFNSLLSGSTVVLAQKSPMWSFVCNAATKDMKLRVQVLNAFTPIANGYIDFTFTLIQV